MAKRTRGWHGDPNGHAKAGQKGGETTSKEHGPEFYRKIGKKGGQATAQAHGASFYRKIGRKGGQRSLGGNSQRAQELGRKGGTR